MIKVAIIGTGFMAQTHADAYRQMNNVELVAITAVNEEKGIKVAKDYSCEYVADAEMLMSRKDIQVIDICTPTFTHEKLVIMGAEAGKHVLCEKPVTLTLESFDRMIAATEKAGVTFMVGQTLRFWPEYMKIKEMVDKGELGKDVIIYANRLAQHPNWGEWFKDVNKSGGGLFDLHLHDIDFMYYLYAPIKSVYAIGKQNEYGAWNHVLTNLIFENGTKSVVESSFEMPEGFPFTMSFRASGEKTTTDFHFSAGINLENLDESESRFVIFDKHEKEIIPVKVEETDPYLNELTYFIDCVQNDKKPEIMPPEENREVLQLMLAIQKSLETGEVQRFETIKNL
ncbi:Gfo/Idh/MocA family protein [Virgibacillus sp. W0181]|uniref:Gfo/Idh/MocA family protein n=1 Tax=Virgibacillus sp. W0181 TaxID=3391581 RepID=UPI003F4569A1